MKSYIFEIGNTSLCIKFPLLLFAYLSLVEDQNIYFYLQATIITVILNKTCLQISKLDSNRKEKCDRALSTKTKDLTVSRSFCCFSFEKNESDLKKITFVSLAIEVQ